MRLAIEGILYNLHTALPCRVTVVHNNSYVNVQPLIQRRYTTGTLVALPEIQMVPVSHPRGQDYWIKLPIAVGDLGTIIFCERSIDSWKVKGYLTDPKDARRHDLSDAIFFPGVYPMSENLPGDADDMILHNGDAELYLQKEGKFLVQGPEEELLDLVSQLADTVQALAGAVVTLCVAVATGVGVDGTGVSNASSAASSAGSDAGTIEGKVDDLTGSV